MTRSNESSGNGSFVASAVTGAAAAGGAASPSARMAANMPRTGVSSLQVEVGGHDAGTAAVGLEGVPPGAAAEVEDAVAWINRKFREIDGQQPGSPLITFRYSATVAAATAGQANRSPTRARPRCRQLRPRALRRRAAPRSAAASSSASPGGHQQRGVAGHLGQRAGPAGDQRRARRHVLHRGQREPLVQRRDHRDLRGGEQPRVLLVRQAARERDPVAEGELRDLLPGRRRRACRRPPGATSRSVASLATARSSVGSPLSGESALVTVTIRPRTLRRLLGARPEEPRVHAERA